MSEDMASPMRVEQTLRTVADAGICAVNDGMDTPRAWE